MQNNKKIMLDGFNMNKFFVDTEGFLGYKYLGEMQDEKMQGQGKIEFSTGDSYEGSCANDFQEGKGIYTWKNLDTYTGDFV